MSALGLIPKQYESGDQPQTIAESCGPQTEEKFIGSLCDLVVAALRLPWQTRSQVANILYSALEAPLSKLLSSYKEYYFEYLAHQIQSHFKIPKNLRIQPEWKYADHAKLKPVFEYVDKWLAKTEEERKSEQEK